MIFTHLVTRIERLRRHGVIDALRCRLARLWLRALHRVFSFDPWHIGAPYACRRYKKIVVALANSLRPEIVVEVGCGLGDIVSRVNAAQRIGIDSDPEVIRAARFLHPRKVCWVHGDGSAINGAIPPDRPIDCLIMVNWIHGVSPEDLAALLLPLLPRIRYLLLDAIDPDGAGSYKFRHDFAFLAGFAQRLSSMRAPDEPRSFVILKVDR